VRRKLDGESSRLPHAALHFLDALLEMRVARIEIAPRAQDSDDRLAAEVLPRVAHLQGA
jgi:hypothetical protein